MKNIIKINQSGRIITTEQKAWQAYLAYVESLKTYFDKEEGRFEIVNDIENRMTELMQGLLNKHNTCITECDINNIIRVMGTVADFKELDEDDCDMYMIPLTYDHTNIESKKIKTPIHLN